MIREQCSISLKGKVWKMIDYLDVVVARQGDNANTRTAVRETMMRFLVSVEEDPVNLSKFQPSNLSCAWRA